MLELGKTKVLCSVYGPRAPQQSQLQQRLAQAGTFASAGTFSVYCRYARFARWADEENGELEVKSREMERLVREAVEGAIQLHKFPKAVLDLHVLVLEDDGGAQGAAITCAGAALANAGVDMLDLPVGCHLGVPSGGKAWTVDPDREESRAMSHVALLAMLPLRGEVTALSINNCGVDGDDGVVAGDGLLAGCLEAGAPACHEVARVCREELRASSSSRRGQGGGE
jgi:exosome complex component MTR3